MGLFAVLLIILGDLRVILEFGSVTFLLVSLLMAYANYTIKEKTNSSLSITLLSMLALFMGTCMIIYYEVVTQIEQLYFIVGIYAVLTVLAYIYAKVGVKSMQKHRL